MMLLELLEGGSPDHIAIQIPGDGPSVTYSQLRSQVEFLAGQLNKLSLGRGDRIAIALPNGLEMMASFLAASTVGTAAPLNPAYRIDEFKFYLEDAGARAIILPAGGGAEARAAAGDAIPVIEADLDGDGKVRFSAANAVGPSRARDEANDDDIALIL